MPSPTPYAARLRPWLSSAAIVLAWQLVAAAHVLPAAVLPAPTELLGTAAALTADGRLPSALAVSLARVAAGSIVGVGSGVALGVVAGLSRLGRDVLDRPLQALRTIPFTALTPLLLLWFGFGETPKVLLVVIATLVPTYLTTVGGVAGVDPALVEMARSFGLDRGAVVRRVVLPGALGPVLVGVRFALGIGWVAVIVAETVNATAGLGYLLTTARDYVRTDVVMVCIVVYAALGLLTDAAVRVLEARLLRWRGP